MEYFKSKTLLPACVVLLIFGSHIQMAPAAAGNARLFELGAALSYQYTSTVLLNEVNYDQQQGKTVGYQITGDLDVSVVWAEGHTRLIEIEFKEPRLLIKSRKAPSPEGFIKHKSDLDTFRNSPFLIEWTKGTISSLYLSNKEDDDFKNIKKGIATLFQFQTLDIREVETDMSGTCQVHYQSLDPHTMLKTKDLCQAPEGVPFVRHTNKVLDTNVTSKRSTIYSFSHDFGIIESIQATEMHSMTVAIKPDAGSIVTVTQELVRLDKSKDPKLLKAATVELAVKEFEKKKRITCQKEHLQPTSTKKINYCSGNSECPSLPKLVKENRDNLQDSYMGTVKSANSFLKLVSAGRAAAKEDITKAFKGSKNKDIRLQLSDLAGTLNTPESYEAFQKLAQFGNEEDLDIVERYLWALSVASNPNMEIMKDLFKVAKSTKLSDKLSETLVLTLSTLAHRNANSDNRNATIISEIKDFVIKNLETCDTNECRLKYLRALKNLKCPTTIPTLLNYALTGKSTSIEAMKAIRSFDKKHWDAKVIDMAQRIYFEAGRKFDSSARTLALDILLESPQVLETYTMLKELVRTLLERDRAFEVKQYLLQRIQQLSMEDIAFQSAINNIYKEFQKEFNNYNTRALRGLTTAFTRYFVKAPETNGSLVTIQEVSSGLLKRGIVDIKLSTKEASTSIFTLGLFAAGLGSFVSSSDNAKHKDSNEEKPEDEVATAGMELSLLGTGIRPFVFFSGQGELMGHVWSGTASEKTPAFQAIILTHDHLEFINLQNGLVAQLQVLGAVSFDLSGQIQISLWNRNAHSLVEQNAGIAMQGNIRIDASFVKSQVEFNVGTEVKLNLISDLSFYKDISLCMQLVQPDATLKHHVHKVERITSSKHRLRKSKYRQISLPGKTYALNKKNNEMCNNIFKSS